MGTKESKLFYDLSKRTESDSNWEKKAKKLWRYQVADVNSGVLKREEAAKFFSNTYDFLFKTKDNPFESYFGNLNKEEIINLWWAYFDADGNGLLNWDEFQDCLNLIRNPDNILKKIQEQEKSKSNYLKEGGDPNRLRIVMSGNADVGKTSLVSRYVDNVFTNKVKDPPLHADDSIVKSIVLPLYKDQINLTIYDTHGQERFRTPTSGYFKFCDAVILVFDLSNRETFEVLDRWVTQIRHYSRHGTPIVLVGNKCDLKPEVDRSEIDIFRQTKEFKYFETSAKEGINVANPFLFLARKLYGAVYPELKPTLKLPASQHTFKVKKNLPFKTNGSTRSTKSPRNKSNKSGFGSYKYVTTPGVG